MVTQNWVKNILKKTGLPFSLFCIKDKFHYQTIQKLLRMKKLLVILAIGAFAACNNASESTEAAVDSVKTAAEATVESVENTADSAKAVIEGAVDSTKAAADSAKEAVKP
ncbi:MAG TPA: hypothetical protein VFV68_09275 [Agriterribacter sp.]|nr:hypothetical protein [Agriterribacter sp.]